MQSANTQLLKQLPNYCIFEHCSSLSKPDTSPCWFSLAAGMTNNYWRTVLNLLILIDHT